MSGQETFDTNAFDFLANECIEREIKSVSMMLDACGKLSVRQIFKIYIGLFICEAQYQIHIKIEILSWQQWTWQVFTFSDTAVVRHIQMRSKYCNTLAAVYLTLSMCKEHSKGDSLFLIELMLDYQLLLGTPCLCCHAFLARDFKSLHSRTHLINILSGKCPS